MGAFEGSWHVHLGTLDIRANGTGTRHFWVGTYQEIQSIRLTRFTSPERLLARVAGVSYVNSLTEKPMPTPSDPCTLAAGRTERGDAFVLHLVTSSFLQSSVLVSHWAPDEEGNPYWCGERATEEQRYNCG